MTARAIPLGLLAFMFCGFLGIGLLDGGGGVLWPDVIDAFGVSKGLFGLLAGLGLGVSFPILLLGGRLTELADKRTLLIVALAAMGCASLGLAGGAGGAVVLALLLMVRAFGLTLLDLANNALAMDAERESGRHLMSPLHSAFSGGTIVGALAVWGLFAADLGFSVAYVGLALFFGVMVAWAVRIPRSVELPAAPRREETPSLTLRLLRRRDVRWFAALSAMAFGAEALVVQWSAIYLREERGLSDRYGAYAVGAYGVAMFVGRVINGPFVERVGARSSLLVQAAIGGCGGVLMVAGGPAPLCVVGCGLAGLGFAGMGPTALSLAGMAVPWATGAASGATLAGGYVGFAGAPLLAGLIAFPFSVRVALIGVAAAGVTAAWLAFKLPPIGVGAALETAGAATPQPDGLSIR